MVKLIKKEEIAKDVFKFVLSAPRIAKKRKPGQFVILMSDEQGERIPLTIADASPKDGTITLIFQVVGKGTAKLSEIKEGEDILQITGPLGKAIDIKNYGDVVCIGGGIGVAPIYPVAKALKEAGNHLISIVGSRNKDLLIMEKEMRSVSNELIISTDDGSYGVHGLVTGVLQKIIDKVPLSKIDLVVAIGPVIMMKAVTNITKKYNIKTMVSLNPIMVDGTGMCGCCRVSISGKSKFVCVDGPEFDAFSVDFDELMKRQKTYCREEKDVYEKHKGHSKNTQTKNA